jgi:hypothetical protein
VRIDPIHGCFNNLEGLNCGNLPSGHDSRVHELANDLRPNTVASSQDLSGA